MRISIIAACSHGWVIGKGGQLPWHLPADLKRFKKITLHHAVVMGRKTAESIHKQLGGPLPDRANYVLTRDPAFDLPGFAKASSPHDVVAAIEMSDETELFFIGGSEVFKATLHFVDRLYLTFIDASFSGDAFFPELDWDEWKNVEIESYKPDKKNPYTYRFAVFERKKI